jgi:phosphohistidine phosphatase
MRELHLLRHAKSSWKDSGLADHDRPLSRRGRQSAEMLAGHLRKVKLAPDLVLCSSALRTRQTLDPIIAAIRPPRVVIERGLYEAGRPQLLARLREVEEGTACVLLIGHNPALQDLALALAETGAGDLLAHLREKFPTGALASYRLERTWRELAPHAGTLLAYVTPRDLAVPPATRPSRGKLA